jgi:hypothetical protein
MTVHDRLRATTEAVTASMREIRPLALPPDPALLAPDQAPLPSPRPRHRRRPAPSPARGPGRRGGRGTWLIPLAAAAAVIAVAATLVSVRDAAGPRPTPPRPATSPAPAPTGAVPAYYVAVQPGPSDGADLDDADEVNSVVVGNAHTGTLLATLKPPKGGTFDGVTGAADDRTFVLNVRSVPNPMGSQHVSYTWYVLRIFPGTARPARLTRLPIADPLKDAVIHGLALSPDGRTLAVMFTPDMAGGGQAGPTTLRTYSVATARPLRTWTGSENDGLVCFTCDNTVDLRWLANGHTLAFLYDEAVLPAAVRTLDLSAPGDSLDADSRAVFPITTANSELCGQGLLSPDGRTMLCGTTGGTAAGYGCATYGASFDAYSTATGKVDRVLYRYRGSCAYAESTFVWAGSDAAAIGLVQVYTTAPAQRQTVTINGTSTTHSVPGWNDDLIFGVIAHGKFSRLRVTMRVQSQGVVPSTPGLIAF